MSVWQLLATRLLHLLLENSFTTCFGLIILILTSLNGFQVYSFTLTIFLLTGCEKCKDCNDIEVSIHCHHPEHGKYSSFSTLHKLTACKGIYIENTKDQIKGTGEVLCKSFKSSMIWYFCVNDNSNKCFVQNIKVLDARKLEIIPPADKSELHFELHSLRNKLPLVVVKVRQTSWISTSGLWTCLSN